MVMKTTLFLTNRTQPARFPNALDPIPSESHGRLASRFRSNFDRGVARICRFGLKWPGKWIFLLVFAFCASAGASGNWLTLANPAKAAVQLMILLSDGTVICANNPSTSSSSAGFVWYRLTPDPFGHYVQGEWSDIAPMHDSRLYYSSQLLHDGRLFVAGGEYGSGGAKAEIYDPQHDLWTQINPPALFLDPTQPSKDGTNLQSFVDAASELLPDGRVLIAPVWPKLSAGTLIYDPRSNTWTNGNSAVGGNQDEATWVKLPDQSILTVDPFRTSSERYIPALERWIQDAPVGVALYSPIGDEMGPGFMLPNGKAFFLGGSGHTALYTPSGNTNYGTWVTGPDIPNGLTAADAPAAMMPNGKILCAVAGAPYTNSSGKTQFSAPTSFFEYDYTVGTTGAFTQVSGPTGLTDNVKSYTTAMLVLPDGSVLFSDSTEQDFPATGAKLYVYVPDGTPVTVSKPSISTIAPNPDGSFHLTGYNLNGFSEGAVYGDDLQMSSDYPIVQFRDPINGHIDYCRTINWSSDAADGTGSLDFMLPQGLIAQPYEVSISVNGVLSDPLQFSYVAPAFIALCPGESTILKLLGASDPTLLYQWSFGPTGFEDYKALIGETNAELNIVSAQTNQTGYYTLGWLFKNDVIISPPVPVAVGVWVVEQPPSTNSAAICQPCSMSVHARGKGTLKARWFRNGNEMVADSRISFPSQPGLPGETIFSINISETKYEDDATYAVLITDDCTHGSTLPFTLRVVPNPPWVRIATEGPAPRDYGAMCYDSDRRVTVLFGGSTFPNSPLSPSGFFGDTWEFDGTNWTQRLPANFPGPRTFASMAYDSWRHRSVLFGGHRYDRSSPTQTQFTPETWEWDGTNWQQIVTAHLPPLPDDHYPSPTCFDSARGEMLLFGYLQDPLWAYDGTDWQVRNAGGAGPKATGAPNIAFDANRGVAVLLGALASAPGKGNSYNESVWEWNGKGWNEMAQSGQKPDLNQGDNAFTYDTFRQECVLFGEEVGFVDGLSDLYTPPDLFRFVWRWNGAQWQADPPTPTPGVSWQRAHSMCFDSARNALVLFGGYGEGNTNVMNYTYEIRYQDIPAVLKQPAVQFAILGQTTQLSVVAAGAPPISYQWQKDGVNLTDDGRVSGSISNILQIAGVTASDFGKYQLAMSNPCGTASSQPIQLRVTTTPLSVVVSSQGIVMAWSDPAAILQTAPAPTGPWTAVPAPTNPYTVVPRAGGWFFRLLH